MTAASTAAENLKGAGLMTAAMAGFAVEDMLLKAAAQGMSVGLVMALFGAVGSLWFAAWAVLAGERIWRPAMVGRAMQRRALSEVLGRIGYTLAIAYAPLSTVSAILQATPLVVVAGAALLLGEKVGWRRWSAILVGLGGVLIILRPWQAQLEISVLFAVLGLLGFAGRDLATRAAPRTLTNRQLGLSGFAVLIPTGLGLYLTGLGGAADAQGGGHGLWFSLGFVVLGGTVGVGAYSALTAAMRMGEVAVVTPFRYTRLLFGIGLGIVAFGERPGIAVWVGSAIVLAAGLYTLGRQAAERRKQRQSS